jgi:hypothetical protein
MYIGVTIDPERRWSQHKSMNTNCSVLKSAIKKYGSDTFIFDLLVCGEDKYIDELEVKAIEKFNTVSPNGYNITLGGDGATKVKWKDGWNKLLGKYPDRVVAEKTSTSIDIVSSRRKGAGIPSYVKANKFDWTDHDNLLGTMSDKDLSNFISISTSSISDRRKLLKIPKFKSPEYNLSKELVNLLGIESDSSLSEKFNIPLTRVTSKRRELNIPAVKQGSWVSKREWTEAELFLIKDTSLTTKQVSSLLNLSRTTVQSKRKELGIKYNRLIKDKKNDKEKEE